MTRQDYCRFIGGHAYEGKEEKAKEGLICEGDKRERRMRWEELQSGEVLGKF